MSNCVGIAGDGGCVCMLDLCGNLCVFFFKQKTAYEIGTGDWSSDVCSSDLAISCNKSA